MAPYEGVKLVSEKLIEYLHVLMEIRPNIKALERSIASRYAVNGHQEFGLRDIDEQIALIRVVIVPDEFDSLAAKRERLHRFECYVRQQSIRISSFLKEVADRIERNDLDTCDVLERG
jgi:hypothetical protein